MANCKSLMVSSLPSQASKKERVALTVEGRSQHLSRLIQLRLQMISNIWSWNYTNTRGEEMKGYYKKNNLHTLRSWRTIKKSFRVQETCTASSSLRQPAEAESGSRKVLDIELMPCQSMCSLHFKPFCFLTYGRGLPPSSRLDHLAKHLEAIQSDVFGLLDGLLRHLLAVHVQLDFLRGDGDVELQELQGGGSQQGTFKQKTALSLVYSFADAHIPLQHIHLQVTTWTFWKPLWACTFVFTCKRNPGKWKLQSPRETGSDLAEPT